MTLKEKFENTMISFLIDRNQDKSMLDHFEKLTEEFAIEFAQWINRVSYRSFDGNWYLTQIDEDIKKTTEELLELFKKEKGL